jgi:hypothetical protein
MHVCVLRLAHLPLVYCGRHTLTLAQFTWKVHALVVLRCRSMFLPRNGRNAHSCSLECQAGTNLIVLLILTERESEHIERGGRGGGGDFPFVCCRIIVVVILF